MILNNYRWISLLFVVWNFSCKAAHADVFAPITSQLAKPIDTQIDNNVTTRQEQVSAMPGFSGKTEVAAGSHSMPIKNIKSGSTVDSSNTKDSEGTVVSISKGVSGSLIEVLTFARDQVETTPRTQFWVSKKGWVAANALFPGDKLTSRNGSLIEVFNVRPESTAGTEVFNLHLEKGSNYYVGKSAILVRGI